MDSIPVVCVQRLQSKFRYSTPRGISAQYLISRLTQCTSQRVAPNTIANAIFLQILQINSQNRTVFSLIFPKALLMGTVDSMDKFVLAVPATSSPSSPLLPKIVFNKF